MSISERLNVFRVHYLLRMIALDVKTDEFNAFSHMIPSSLALGLTSYPFTLASLVLFLGTCSVSD